MSGLSPQRVVLKTQRSKGQIRNNVAVQESGITNYGELSYGTHKEKYLT
jgi:hypothetical protein